MQLIVDTIKGLKYREKPIMLKVTIKLDRIQKVLSSLLNRKLDNSNTDKQ